MAKASSELAIQLVIKKDLQAQKKCAYNLIVAVRSDKLKPLNSTLALGFCFRVLTEGRAKWLFLCLFPLQPYSTRQQRICMDGLEENTDNRTHPLVCRSALIERLIKDWVQRWNKAQSISESIRQAHLVALVFS